MGCIVAGDIGCYTLGVMEPYQAMDTCVAMGASVGVGLGLRHVLPEDQARKVVSVIGDSTFIHSGLSGLVEMVYNPPATGHVLLVLDNGTTAMTGQQEHPGTGRTMAHDATGHVSIEGMARAAGVTNVDVVDPVKDPRSFEELLTRRLASNDLSVIVSRRPCILAAADIRHFEKVNAEKAAAAASPCAGCGSDDA
jgi:indolepyruvate ferredoxin oxidoreductase alpha subunit